MSTMIRKQEVIEPQQTCTEAVVYGTGLSEAEIVRQALSGG